MMKHLTTSLFLSALAVCVQAQNVANYQPDANGDGCIGSSDILSLLSLYGSGDCPPFECGDPLEYQGYEYATVQIGEQCWFAENLRSESYMNGDVIPAGLNQSEWWDTTTGAVAVYGEGSSNCEENSPDGDACDEAWSLNEYGCLYNLYAVYDDRGLCPSGWHVSADEEWMTMELWLGMDEVDLNGSGPRGTDQGTQMKTNYGWMFGVFGTNASGFSGLPGGRRDMFGNFTQAGITGYWWSPSPSGAVAYGRFLDHSEAGVGRQDYTSNERTGFSIRCVQD